MSRTRTGNIARLPRLLRDQVNRMLDDGSRFNSIIAWLAQNGHPGVKLNNLTEWKKGGFQDWLELHQRLAQEEKLRELSYAIATANEGTKTQEAAIQVASSFLFRVFLKLSPERLAKELDWNPKQIPTVLNSFARLNRRSIEADMIKEYARQQEERRRAAAEAKVVTEVPPALSEPSRAQIEHDHNL